MTFTNHVVHGRQISVEKNFLHRMVYVCVRVGGRVCVLSIVDRKRPQTIVLPRRFLLYIIVFAMNKIANHNLYQKLNIFRAITK